MNIGDYVKNKYGYGKVISIIKGNDGYCDIVVFDNDLVFMVDKDGNEIEDEPLINKLPLWEKININKIKRSINLIDLIEVGDLMYVDICPDDCGGIVVPRVAETINELIKYKKKFKKKEYILKGIVSKEQLQKMTYWVGD